MDSDCIRCGRELKDPWSIRAGIGPVCQRKALADILQSRSEKKPRVNYRIISVTSEIVTIEDLGPWDQYMTVTNGAEFVISELTPLLGTRRLLYVDSEGNMDELLHNGEGKFEGFRHIASMEKD